MIGKLIAFDKNGSDLNTMMKCLWLIRNKGANDCISRFQFKREMELFDTGVSTMPAVEPPGYIESSRNLYNKTKFMRMFGMIGLVDGPNAYPDIVITKRGNALMDCVSYTVTTGPTGSTLSFTIDPTKMKKYNSMFVDGFVYGSFGKNNVGLEESNTDVEYSKIILKTILLTGYITSAESFYIADGMNEGLHSSYEAAINSLVALRMTGSYRTTIENTIATFVGGVPGVASKPGRINFANDNKILSLLCQLNILQEQPSTLPKMHRHYIITRNALNDFSEKFQLLLPVYRPLQVVLSGVPGTGKSFYVENTILGGNSNPNNVIRTIIHPDYTYSDFVGFQKPQKNVSSGKIEFEFNPGPLSVALERCYKCPKENVYLIIEEMNRGDFAAIMGDTFQLLDRIDDFTSPEHGCSRFPIMNKQVYDYLVKKIPSLIGLLPSNRILFPSNLHIIGTMNTADQNVFVLDTAFRRRFRNIYLKIDFSESADPSSYLHSIDTLASTNIFAGLHTWTDFAKKVNEKIDEINADSFMIPEDKKLAPYFVNVDDVSDLKAFCDKVMYYLKSDVFMYVEDFFSDSYQKMYQDMVLTTPPKNPYSYL